MKRSNASSNKQQKEVQKALDSAQSLRNTIKNHEIKVEKQRKAISQIEEERDHYLHEATEQVFMTREDILGISSPTLALDSR